MTPVERLQAAIALLQLHEGQTWHEDGDDGLGTLAVSASNPGGGRAVAGLMGLHDAHLIVTLHRTIDAQLQILQHALARAEAKLAGGGVQRAVWSHERDALRLADAIVNTPALAEGADPNSPDSERSAD